MQGSVRQYQTLNDFSFLEFFGLLSFLL